MGQIAYMDARRRYRAVGDWPHFTLWFLPGLALLQLGGSLVEVTSTAGAAVVVALAVNGLPRQTRSTVSFDGQPVADARRSRGPPDASLALMRTIALSPPLDPPGPALTLASLLDHAADSNHSASSCSRRE